MQRSNNRPSNEGFTIVEVMVSMVILAIGLLGMAGVTLMVIKGGSDASKMTYATNLAADEMESLKDVPWSDLGSVADCTTSSAPALLSGCSGQQVLVEEDLNEQGDTETVPGAQGPYPFMRKSVVCVQGSNKDSNTSDRCSNNPSLIPPELSCNPNAQPSSNPTEVGTDEKKIKVLVSWRDRTGRCHTVDMISVQGNFM